VLGPRCTLWIPSTSGVSEFTLGETGEWVRSAEVTELSGGARVFSPANLRCTADSRGYAALVNYYMAERYTLRYTGGLVPDVCAILSRRAGIFTSPVSAGGLVCGEKAEVDRYVEVVCGTQGEE